ncbi:alanine--tRNA ligase [Solicola sp. PLA-1-18]|uniref:alanine--tRNA ligase n=1 Tax=Solicola sp. PLA-1-18 TaxID=3380532 RepID=UPI003B7944F6
MDTAEIRRRFLQHFEDAGHQVVPSASLIAHDPTLLFVAAGMVPFKPYFLGDEQPPGPRATSVQKCVRTPDIEDVGRTTRHGTFFEMCGNFSFGDYFKQGAIELAWDLVTKPLADGGWGLEESRLYPSVYEDDAEAVELWRKVTGLPDDRVIRLGKSENYWSMGVPGPGGPCSEILYDRGPAYGADGDFGAEDRYLELWNLVFMQDELSAVRSKSDFDISGSLPKKNIDTGMGLERVAFLLQGKDNMYEIDVMYPVIEKAEELTGKRYGADPEDDVRLRVVADHVRSSLMLIGDGVTPGNEGRGYVLRRLLRRAVRSMRLLGVEDPTLPELLPVSKDKMAETYTSLETDFARIERVAYGEEEAFRDTLAKGTQIFDVAVGRVRESGRTSLGGDEAFELHDTFGFPIDLTLEMASEQGLAVDEAGFRALMTQQRDRAREDARAKKGQQADVKVYGRALEQHGDTDWRAYTDLVTESGVQELISAGGTAEEATPGTVVEVVLDRSPFYAESGGQSADAGTLTWDGGTAEVLDVQRPVGGLVVHQVRVLDGTLRPGATLEARVDQQYRLGACQAHTATHVIGAALRENLGPSAQQSGSFNRPGFLRLDFGWSSGLDAEQLAALEQEANHVLRQDIPVTSRVMPKEEALAMGAQALFGEKYPEIVRVVEIDGAWSRELCGGTHVESTAQIGTMVLTSEGSVSAGNRRVEMVTGYEGFGYLSRERDLVAQLADMLKTQHEDVPARVRDLLDRLRVAEKEVERIKAAQLLASGASLVASAHDVGGVTFLGHHAEGVGGGDVRTLALDLRGRLGNERPAVVTVVGTQDGKAACVVAVNAAGQAAGVSAGDLVRTALEPLGGRGGGKADVAQGGGADNGAVPQALAAVEQALAARS